MASKWGKWCKDYMSSASVLWRIHHPNAQGVTSWRLGNNSSNAGGSINKKTVYTRKGIISFHSVCTLDCTNVRTLDGICACKSGSLCTHTHAHIHTNVSRQVNELCMSTPVFRRSPSPAFTTKIKTCCTPFSCQNHSRLQLLHPLSKINDLTLATQTVLLLLHSQNIHPKQLPIVPQSEVVLEIQTSFRLTSRLPLLLNKAPIVWNL